MGARMRGNLLQVLYDTRADQAQAYRFYGGVARANGEVKRLIAQMASALRQFGVDRGDRVSFKMAKCEEALILAHACLQIGAVLHPLNPAYTEPEIVHLVTDAGSRLLVAGEEEASRLGPTFAGTEVASLSTGMRGTLGEAASQSESLSEICDLDSDAVAALLYTSGTTGRPKGACITHSNLVESARALAQLWRLSQSDRLLHVLPMYHAHGLLTALNSILVAGGSILFLKQFDPADAIAALPDASVLMAVPTHYGRLLKQNGLGDATKNLRLAISGSAPLSTQIADRFAAMTGRRILERYGATETAIVTALPAGTSSRAGFVGWPLPGVEVRVTCADDKRASHGIGVLETRGHNVFAGYWRSPEATKRAFTSDGWFITGDVAEIDSTGCVRLIGRKTDLIITGGLNVYPKEVEVELDSLLEEGESVVFGVEHPDLGEAVVAVVEGAVFNEQALIGTLRERLAAYKVPKKILGLRCIPKNQTGKILKNSLRDQYTDLFVDSP